jgi:thiamine-phosphate pyrophosphorylase
LSALCHRYGARLIINDDVALALACGADGVHLGREDVSIAEALARDPQRKLMLGVSCYNSLELAVSAQAAGAHYVAFGSFFASPTKPDAAQAPLSLLAAARQALHISIVAIGGVTLHNVDQLISAGADAVAVITALFDAPDIAATAAQFQHYFQEPYEQSQRSTV